MDFEQTVRDELGTVKTNGEYFDPESAAMRILAAHRTAVEQAEQAARVAELEKLAVDPHACTGGYCTLCEAVKDRLAQLTESKKSHG